MCEPLDYARFSDPSVEKRLADGPQTETQGKPGTNTNLAWRSLAAILKKLPRPPLGRNRSDSGDSEATLVGESEEQEEFAQFVKTSKKASSPPLVRQISWAPEPVRPPKAIIITDYDTGKRSDPCVDSDRRTASGVRGRAPSPYPGRSHDYGGSEEISPDAPRPPQLLAQEIPTDQGPPSPLDLDSSHATDLSPPPLKLEDSKHLRPTSKSKDHHHQAATVTVQPIPEPRTPSPSPSRRRPTRPTCQCPLCAAASSPHHPAQPPRSRPGWVGTDPSRWDDGGASAPRLLWLTPAEPASDDGGTTAADTRYVTSVRPSRGRTAGRGHPLWAPSHSPAPGWRFAEAAGLWGVDAGELREVLGRLAGRRGRGGGGGKHRGGDARVKMDDRPEKKERIRSRRRHVGRCGSGGGGAGFRRHPTPRDDRSSWRYAVMWEADCYNDMFGMYLG